MDEFQTVVQSPSSRRLYYSLRTVSLAAVIVFSIAWFLTGFDSTVEQVIYPDQPGIGTHWSTLQSVFLMTYFLSLNFQVGGVKSLSSLWIEVKRDLKGIPGWNKHEYLDMAWVVNPYRALIPILFIPLFATALFEVPYIFLLNYFQFGSLMYPVYTYDTVFLRPVFFRNFVMLIAPVMVSIIVLRLRFPAFGSPPKLHYRLDKILFCLAVLTVFSFGSWIYYPSHLNIETSESLNLDSSHIWVLPAQKMFAQTVNFYVDETPFDGGMRSILAWHVDNPPIHFINLLTKYLVFLSVGYLFLVKVEVDHK